MMYRVNSAHEVNLNLISELCKRTYHQNVTYHGASTENYILLSVQFKYTSYMDRRIYSMQLYYSQTSVQFKYTS
jgi:hypothetical protein